MFRHDEATFQASTADRPLDLRAVGLDIFVQNAPQRRVFWFRNPACPSEVYHTCAKVRVGQKDRATGRRYCHLCHRVISANNFVHQHLRQMHSLCLTDRSDAPDEFDLYLAGP